MAGIIVAASVFGVFFSFWNPSKQTVVTINGISLPVQLYEEEMEGIVPKVYSYFESEYQVQNLSTEEFWENSYNGEIPVDYARKLVLEKWVRYIVVLQEAQKNDLIQDVTYDGLIELWQKENDKRKEDLEAGKIIYGPYQYSWDGFLDVQITNYSDELVKKYAETEFLLSDEQLKKIYDEEKNAKYRYDDDVSVEILKCDYNQEDVTGESKEKASQKIQQIHEAACQSGDLKAISKKMGVPVETQDFLLANAELDNESYGVLRQTALQLSPQETSEILQDPSQGFYAVMQCLERTENGYIPFDEKKEEIQLEYSQKNLEDRINSLIAEADVVINDAVYCSIYP